MNFLYNVYNNLQKMKIIYTDGSCLKNPGGAGGWAICLIKDNGREYLISEGNPHTTNNRMELQANILGNRSIYFQQFENRQDHH